MNESRNAGTKTYEVLTRKISMTKINGEPGRALLGWEYAPPRKGERYAVYLGRGRILRTSPVEDIKDAPEATLMIKTANSFYRLEYMNAGPDE